MEGHITGRVADSNDSSRDPIGKRVMHLMKDSSPLGWQGDDNMSKVIM